MKYLLDTCVISELPHRRPDPQVIGWLRVQDPETLYLSFVTIEPLDIDPMLMPDRQVVLSEPDVALRLDI